MKRMLPTLLTTTLIAAVNTPLAAQARPAIEQDVLVRQRLEVIQREAMQKTLELQARLNVEQQARAARDAGGALSDDEIAARRERLRARSAAFLVWAARTCDLTAEQLKAVATLFEDKLRTAAEGLKNPQRHEKINDFAPIVFTQERNEQNYLYPGRILLLVRNVLPADLQTALFEAIKERRESIRSANLDYIVSMVDDEISLTPEQLQGFRDALWARIGRVHHRLYDLDAGLFSLGRDTGVLRRCSLDVLLSNIAEDVLTEDQQLVLDSLTTREREREGRNADRSVRIVFDSDQDDDSLSQQLKEAVAQERQNFESVITDKVAVAAARWSLSEPEKRKLLVAAMGVAERRLTRWKAEMAESLLSLTDPTDARQLALRRHLVQLNLPMELWVAGPSVSGIEHDALWLHTLEKVKPPVARQARPFRREALVGYVTGMLDKELWLTPDQREPLRKLVDSAFPQVIEIQQPDAKEFELLVVPLFRIPDDQLTTVLREPQLAAWKAIQNEFHRDGETVTLWTEAGGISFRLPQ